MSRARDVREDIHQPLYDTYLRGIGVSTATNNFQLFGNANVGRKELTNLPSAGFLAADQLYAIKAMRAVLWFQGLNDDEFNTTYNTATTALANVVADNRRAEDMYQLAAYGGVFTLIVGQKPMLQSMLWYIPAGGGITGATSESDRHALTNGLPSHDAILRLGLPVLIDARQNFSVQLEWFTFARLGSGNGAGGGAIGADIDPLLYLNQFDGAKLIQIHLDGFVTRDVQ